MTDNSGDYHDYSAVQPDDEGDDALAEVRRLAREQQRLERALEVAERGLSEAKQALAEVAERALPAAMAKFGLEEFRLEDGTKISVGETIRASIPAAKAPDALAWLRDHDHGSMVRTEFKLKFGANEDQAVADAHEALSGFEYDEKQSVHPSTLSAWAKEMLAEGEPFPHELFGLFRQRKSKIG